MAKKKEEKKEVKKVYDPAIDIINDEKPEGSIATKRTRVTE